MNLADCIEFQAFIVFIKRICSVVEHAISDTLAYIENLLVAWIYQAIDIILQGFYDCLLEFHSDELISKYKTYQYNDNKQYNDENTQLRSIVETSFPFVCRLVWCDRFFRFLRRDLWIT